MTTALPCPVWCVEHEAPDPLDPRDGGRHSGQEMSVLVGESARHLLPAVFVQLNAHDCNGVRHSWIDLVVPTRVHAEMAVSQARELAEALLEEAEIWDARVLADGLLQSNSCPPWCTRHDEAKAVDPLVDRWHYSRMRAVPAIGPRLSGPDVRVRLCAKDTRFGRRVVVGLVVQDDETAELTGAEARRIAAALLNATDEIEAAA